MCVSFTVLTFEKSLFYFFFAFYLISFLHILKSSLSFIHTSKLGCSVFKKDKYPAPIFLFLRYHKLHLYQFIAIYIYFSSDSFAHPLRLPPS